MRRTAIVALALAMPCQAMAMLWGADADFRKAVAWGKRVQVGHEQSWDGFCQSTGAEVTITVQPQHGMLEQVREPSTVRHKGSCQGAHITALNIYYTPERGYEGPDQVSFDSAFGNGMSRHVDAHLTVVAGFVPVHEGQVFHIEPAPGSLEGQPGMRIYVDDRSCPNGEIKQLVLGDVHKGVPRTTACVAR